MAQDECEKVELPALTQLQQLGWTYIDGKKLLPEKSERNSLRDVVLVNRLNDSIKRINPWISEDNLRKVSRQITHPVHAGLMEYNQSLWNLLFGERTSVPQNKDGKRQDQTVTFIDTENPVNNEYLCTNQFKVEGPNKPIIPDIICFVNGIPLAVIECKSPYITSPIDSGIDQLRRYANLREPHEDEGAERLFWYNQLMISICRSYAKVGTISAVAQHYGYWKDAYPMSDEDLLEQLKSSASNEIRDSASAAYDPASNVASSTDQINAQQRLLAGMFAIDSFLDLMQNFVIFEVDDGKLIKKVARYQQYRAVNRVIKRIRNGADRKAKSGVVWHTQGSGKSLTMVMLAIKMRRDPVLRQYKLVFVTDRTQLDGQLSKTFEHAQDETVQNAGSVKKLKELLQSDTSDLITTTVQKFSDMEREGTESFTNINTSDKIIVLADEAHRTQFGGLAMTINAALPNAPKIGFTGTPLLKTQKMGDAFGGYIDQYKINEAVEDRATVRILYEGRQALVDVSGESLDSLFEEYFADYTTEQKREIKKRHGVDKAVREAPARVRRVCIDLLDHYRTTVQPDGFKAMIVVGSRHAATVFKEKLDELGAPESAVIFSGQHNEKGYLAQYTNKADHKTAIDNFKKPITEHPLSILIVKDMLLTGFDAPIAQVMYIDRSLKEHTLMQAIARVNRTYKNKKCGYVVDYYGLADELSDALELFSSDEVDGTYHTLKDEIPRLKALHAKAMAFFKDVVVNNPKDKIDQYVLALKEEEVRALFNISFVRFARQMNIVLPDKAAGPFIADLRLLGKVQHGARNMFHEHSMNLGDVGEKVQQLVDEHIISTGVDPKIPPIDLMANNFRDKVNQNNSPEAQAAEVESAIKDHIDVNIDEDPEYYKSLSLRLRDIIEKNQGRWDRQLELMFELRDNMEAERQQQADDLGLNDTELAFYNILMSEVTGTEDADVLSDDVHDEIKATTQHLVEMFIETTQIVDIFKKPDQIKTMRKQIKRTVMDQSFGTPELVKTLQERFLDLAKTKYGS